MDFKNIRTRLLKALFLMFLPSACLAFQYQQHFITANEVVERMKQNLTSEWHSETVDTFKAGNPELPISGIATTFMATMEVLQKAKSQGINFVITHEPIFYNHFDATDLFGIDSVIDEKQKYIAAHGLVVFRFHDHIHKTTPDGIYRGVMESLQWQDYEIKQRPYLYKIPETTLSDLADQLQTIFPASEIRVVGDKKMKVTKASLVLGAPGSMRQIESLQQNDVEVLIGGETHEWETVEYVRDAVSQGRKKALILLGHVNSEEAGMEYCAEWLKTFVSEVPVTFIPAGDPFWSPH